MDDRTLHLSLTRWFSTMAIIFRCMCGKKMQARDELAGRLMQCPICCYLFKIPGEGPGNFVRFTCGCGLKLKAYSFNAGEEVDCPGCGRPAFRHDGRRKLISP